MAECRRDLSLCAACGGLQVLEARPLDVLGFTLNGPDGPIATSGPTTLYLTRLEPCPNTPQGDQQ
ncbi:hypothetical protein DI272_18730 [Streptomyces sp. Act143]|uniref:hypothetical protein n=1 Tax=Streptomyces sp. Act143 TaxID=2200760 RepID=UPI000D6792EF|nr:hypothetical protein [Streptomyces sp. Act143]PWI15971.1 hypothetical protein DI272_18730 [Streptomyces sp. Act143]